MAERRVKIVSDLLSKKRKELLVMGSQRVSYSEDDVMLEDFFDMPEHSYVIYDMDGELVEANFEYTDKDYPLYELYKKALRVLRHMKDGE